MAHLIMQTFLSFLPALLFAPATAAEDAYLAQSTDLADLERREAALEAGRRENLAALH
ncbi:MAG: DUF3563 family protein [Proteobacteria bacterium]|nr:DUF3563 family protein [Pseudomonadota bacterium]